MARVTTEDILNFNKLYFKYKSFAEVARQTGFSASTVSKYVDKNWKPLDEGRRKIFDPMQLKPDFKLECFKGVENFGELCVYSAEEEAEVHELWEEMDI